MFLLNSTIGGDCFMAIMGPNGQQMDPAAMNSEMMGTMPPDAFAGATAADMAAMPPHAMGGMNAGMMGNMPPPAMGGMGPGHMEAMPPHAMQGMGPGQGPMNPGAPAP